MWPYVPLHVCKHKDLPTSAHNWQLDSQENMLVRWDKEFSSVFERAGESFSSVQACLTLCDPMDCSLPGLPGLPVHHQLLEFTQTYVHWVSDAIQPSHPLSPPLLLLSIFLSIKVFSNKLALPSGGQSIGASVSPSVLPGILNIQGWFPLGLIGLISLLSKGLSRVFFNTTVQKHELFSTQPSSWSNSHIYTRLLEKP